MSYNILSCDNNRLLRELTKVTNLWILNLIIILIINGVDDGI